MGPMYYIGLDVHKQKISYCVKDGSGTILAGGKRTKNCRRRTLLWVSEYLMSGNRVPKRLSREGKKRSTESSGMS